MSNLPKSTGNGQAAPAIEPLDKADPLNIARRFLRDRYTLKQYAKVHTLWQSADVFYAWDGVKYAPLELAAIRSEIYKWLEVRERWQRLPDGGESVTAFKPTKRDVDQVIDALRALVYTSMRPPAWCPDCPFDPPPDPSSLLVAINGIFDMAQPSIPLVSRPSPLLFNVNAIDYEFQSRPPRPRNWLAFLQSLWPDAPETVQLVQEWFGYVLSGETRQQKILLLYGPTRSGKGTMMRVLARMLGMANVCAPTLGGLASHFGLWSLMGKRLAIISDARLSGRTDQAAVVERLLNISGEDAITIERKNLPAVTEKLGVRIVICTNELPRLSDSSGALPGRFLIAPLTRSFLGHEDLELEDRLLAELPGILAWAIFGWHRLRERGHFVQPTEGNELLGEMNDLASPASAFVRDCCELGEALRTPIADVYESWRLWCAEQGRDQPGTVQVFSRDLRAACPSIIVRQIGAEQVRHYEGIGLQAQAEIAVTKARVDEAMRESRYGGSR